MVRSPFAAAAFSGEGARRFGGRWNPPGVAMVYCSTSLALAALETFVNLEPRLQPDDLVAIVAQLPDAIRVESVAVQTLPPDWNRSRPEALQTIGADWIRRGSSVALRVPSAAVLGELNVLLNPAHAEFRKLVRREPIPFRFDLRMYGR